MDIVCLPGETRLDDFNISEDCESDQVYFGVRLTTLIIHALLLIACVAHHIRFRRSVSILFKPNQWEHVHASTIMIFFLMVYAICTTITFALALSGRTGANDDIAYLVFFVLSHWTVNVWLIQIMFSMMKMVSAITREKVAILEHHGLTKPIVISNALYLVACLLITIIPKAMNWDMGLWFFIASAFNSVLIPLPVIAMCFFVLRLMSQHETPEVGKDRANSGRRKLIALISFGIFGGVSAAGFFIVSIFVPWLEHRAAIAHAFGRSMEALAGFLMFYIFGYSKSLLKLEERQSTRNSSGQLTDIPTSAAKKTNSNPNVIGAIASPAPQQQIQSTSPQNTDQNNDSEPRENA